uniref:Chromo domain-containing protein n=1 Tax=Hyaloperonospora arabidopsidis (strain Emoy2) TaxID=559515 RepID=M4C3H0_HYAAE
MTESIRQPPVSSGKEINSANPVKWRRESNRQREIALKLANTYQVDAKSRRAKEHNERLSPAEQRRFPRKDRPETTTATDRQDEKADTPNKTGFGKGYQVWLFMEKVKTGLTKKLAHRWHGPFRIKRQVEDFAYELELPDRSGYRFHPVVHISCLKRVNDTTDRPTTTLFTGLEDTRSSDFDEELLPEERWIPDEESGRYEVEAIVDDYLPLSTSTDRTQRRFLVKWKGYEGPTWERLSNLSCGVVLFDYQQQKKRDNRFKMVQVADEC